MQQTEKVRTAPLVTAPVNNTVRRLHWLRKRTVLENNPKAHFPLTIFFIVEISNDELRNRHGNTIPIRERGIINT